MGNSTAPLAILADEWLQPSAGEIRYRHDLYLEALSEIGRGAGTIAD